MGNTGRTFGSLIRQINDPDHAGKFGERLPFNRYNILALGALDEIKQVNPGIITTKMIEILEQPLDHRDLIRFSCLAKLRLMHLEMAVLAHQKDDLNQVRQKFRNEILHYLDESFFPDFDKHSRRLLYISFPEEVLIKALIQEVLSEKDHTYTIGDFTGSNALPHMIWSCKLLNDGMTPNDE